MSNTKTHGELAASLRTMFAARVPHLVMPGQGPAWSITGTTERLEDLLAASEALDRLAVELDARLAPIEILPDGTVRPVFCGADCVDEGLCRDTQSCDRVGAESVGRVNLAPTLLAPVAQPVSASEEFDAPASCPAREAMGVHACQDRAQCWEPCGALGQSAAHVTVSKDYTPAPGVESEGGEG